MFDSGEDLLLFCKFQVKSLAEEKRKLERKMSAKNEEIVSLTYNHENNKMRIRFVNLTATYI